MHHSQVDSSLDIRNDMFQNQQINQCDASHSKTEQ